MKLLKNKNNLALILPLVIVAGVFVFGHQARADWAVSVVSGILGVFIWALGVILMIVIKGLILIAQYQSFIDSQAVIVGWVIVRDVCNMFFVVVMLIIAFGTILHLENYSYKKWLPKLILMAILINFSKTICGLLIDVSQVVMMTFVNAFKDVGGANLTDILGLSQIVTLAKDDGAEISLWTVVGAYVLGIIYLMVAVVVIVTMMMMLVMRLVMIWIYVVLSPAAFLTSAFPGGEKFSSDWWSEFTKNLLVGPVLAFFIWLSFASLQSYNSSSFTDATSVDAELNVLGEQDTNSKKAIVATEASKPASLIQFVIAIGMLLGGLKVSQEIGGRAGNLAGKGMAKIQSGAAFAVSGARNLGKKGLVAGAVMAGTSKGGQKVLGDIAASSNSLLKYSGVRNLAAKGLVAANMQKKEIEAKAQKKIENLNNTKVTARYVREFAFTPEGKALKKKATSMMPSALGDKDKIEGQIRNMSREDLNKISDPEWRAIGASGAKLDGRAPGYIQKNSDERGAYNRGKEQYNAAHGLAADAGFVRGTDKNGNPLDPVATPDAYGSYMNPNRQPIGTDEENRLDREGQYATSYLRNISNLQANTITKVDSERISNPRGNGNLSVNEFAKEKSDTAAVDFDKLNIKGIDRGGGSDYRNVRGVNTNDPALIREISTKMVNIIDQELNKLKEKGGLTAGDQKRMENLESAKIRFNKSGGLDNISLVNSSAADYKLGDVKEAKIHEEIHGLGYENEEDTRYATQKIVDSRQYDARKDKKEIDKILVSKPERKSIDDVIKNEEKSGLESESENTAIDFKKVNSAVDGFSKKLDDLSKNLSSVHYPAAAGSSSQQPNFAYLFGGLKKAIGSQNANLSKKISALGGEKASTPLEVDVISQQVSDKINKKVV
jgi:hypothetical protein